MVKAKLRFDSSITREKFIEYFEKDICQIEKIKCNYYHTDCGYEIIIWLNMPFDKGKELIFTNLRKAMNYHSSAFELYYIKERRNKNGRKSIGSC